MATSARSSRLELDSWPIGRPFRLLERMRALTLEVILRAVIGVDGHQLAPF